MASGSQRISTMIFQRTFERTSEGFVLDAQMLRILELIDGQSTVDQIAARLGTTPIDLKPGLAKLYKQKLIQPVSPEVQPLAAAFFSELENILANAIGPIARIVLNDCIHQLGSPRDNFPTPKAAQLIQRIAAKITDPSARRQFIQRMTVKLREIK
jgi:hypothetical protein